MRPSRIVVTTALAALSALAVAVPATAAPPARIPLPAEGFIDDTGAFCGFPIDVEIVQNREKLTAFADGRILITGVFKVRLTNLADPDKSILVNASAAVRGNESSTGSQLFFLSDPAEVFGRGIFLVHGNVTPIRDDQGAIVDADLHGSVSGNLCDLIA